MATIIRPNPFKITQKLMEKPSIQQMHYGMFHTSNIDINRHPIKCFLLAKNMVLILMIQKPQKVPGAIHECVKCVSIVKSFTSTAGTFRFIQTLFSLEFLLFFGHFKVQLVETLEF